MTTPEHTTSPAAEHAATASEPFDAYAALQQATANAFAAHEASLNEILHDMKEEVEWFAEASTETTDSSYAAQERMVALHRTMAGFMTNVAHAVNAAPTSMPA